MPDYNDHNYVVNQVTAAQDSDKDNLEHSRECEDFLHRRDGQWEDSVYETFSAHPRYTLDLANPIVDQISGQIKKADFAIKVRPAGGNADDKSADLMAGMVRNIENISNAQHIYNKAAEGFIGSGVDGWMVTQEWAEEGAFDQDLFIRPVPNFIDSVVFDPDSQEQDRSDSKWALKKTAMSKEAFKEKYPKRTGKSLPEDRENSSYYFHKPEQVVIGDFFYIKMKKKVFIKLSNGMVSTEEELKPILDELAAGGITEETRRDQNVPVVYVRKMDGEGWINDEQETVFRWIPLIPTYGKFKVIDNKIVYRSAIDKILDPCRVHNYAYSRIVSDTVLSPKPKIWMTREQSKGNENTLRTMNTNNNPVQFYNHIANQPAPYQVDGTTSNPTLQAIMGLSNQAVTQATGIFASNQGDNPGLQSGVAIEQLQEAGSTGTLDWFEALEVAKTHTGRILINAIPRVYDATRQVRILGEDGEISQEVINSSVIDNQTGQLIPINDLSKGRYDISVSVGKSYKSRQEESVAAILEMGQVDPSIITEGSDVLLKNTNAPGLDLIADRKRAQLLNGGFIPQDQWTDEERAQIEQAQAMAAQNQQPDAAMMLAQAEMVKAQADQQEAQNKLSQIQLDAVRLQQQTEATQGDQALQAAKLQQDGEKNAISAAQQQQQFDLSIEKAVQEIQLANQKELREMRNSMVDNEKKMAETLKTLREAMGVDTIVGPSNTEAYINQADEIVENQETNQ